MLGYLHCVLKEVIVLGINISFVQLRLYRSLLVQHLVQMILGTITLHLIVIQSHLASNLRSGLSEVRCLNWNSFLKEGCVWLTSGFLGLQRTTFLILRLGEAIVEAVGVEVISVEGFNVQRNVTAVYAWLKWLLHSCLEIAA